MSDQIDPNDSPLDPECANFDESFSFVPVVGSPTSKLGPERSRLQRSRSTEKAKRKSVIESSIGAARQMCSTEKENVVNAAAQAPRNKAKPNLVRSKSTFVPRRGSSPAPVEFSFPKPQMMPRPQSMEFAAPPVVFPAPPMGSQPEPESVTPPLLRRSYSMNPDQKDPKLPLLAKPNHPDVDSISADTLAGLMMGNHSVFDHFIVFDCRFTDEYEGGHIRNAFHCQTSEQWEAVLAANRELHELGARNRIAVIFYCEFSSYRGPAMWKKLRNWDRTINSNLYPRLHFPQAFLLEHGYSNFYNNYPQLCDPQNYIEMKDDRFKRECQIGMATLKNKPQGKNRSHSMPDLGSLSASLSTLRVQSPPPDHPRNRIYEDEESEGSPDLFASRKCKSLADLGAAPTSFWDHEEL